MFTIKKVFYKEFGLILAPFTEAHEDYVAALRGWKSWESYGD